jgi:energy-coupling factor transporter ATP-binding protein EcfA2
MKVNTNLENCYGISKLEYSFDFSTSAVYAIYAPNGFMKTSLSKTFDDIAKGRPTSDLIFPERPNRRDVTYDDGKAVEAGNIFVIEPYNQDFSSEKTSLLLVNQVLKKQYDAALKAISDKQQNLFAKLKQLSGLTGRTVTPESEFCRCFNQKSALDGIEGIRDEVEVGGASDLSTIVYAELFNEKTLAFLESGAIASQLEEYISKYNDLVSQSPILSKAFNHYHASTVNKQLASNGFFAAQHSVNLKSSKGEERIESADELTKKIDGEKQKIFADKDLAGKFDAIDKKIQNDDLRKFRDYLFDNQHILPSLQDFKKLQKEIWVAYLIDQKELFIQLCEEYKNGKEIIEASVAQAKTERTDWETVVAMFNRRFSVPFTMRVANQDDVILKGSAPQIAFIFADSESSGSVDRDALLKVLSQGEKRALYILNILFEIHTRQKQEIETILLVDDIADSFDYKNKYAIIEYLRDIANSGKFKCIFLSHNFDFHRTVGSRLNVQRKKRLHAQRNGRTVVLSEEQYQKNPFLFWKDNLVKPRYCISAIPFVRNLAEYSGQQADYEVLTSLLHIKPDTLSITCKNLEDLYKRILVDKQNLVLNEPSKPVIDLIYESAQKIANEALENAELESKIVLSIAIRLRAESHMIARINDSPFVNAIQENQTLELLKKYKTLLVGSADEVDLLEQVNLMTPENIHLNSFMFEPILDMGSEHLRNLYADVSALQ